MQPRKPRSKRSQRKPSATALPSKPTGVQRRVLVSRSHGGEFSKDTLSLLAEIYRCHIQLARDAHTRLGQNLTALKMESYVCAKRLAAMSRCPADARESLAKMNGWLEDLSIYSRELVAQLTPNILIQLGFEAAAAGAVRTSNQRSKGSSELVREGRALRMDVVFSALVFDLFCEVLSELEKFAVGKIHLKFSSPNRVLAVSFELGSLQRQYQPGGNIRCLVAALGGQISCTVQGHVKTIELRMPILDLERLN
jgi:glucose-6-phosphate-specific signal transduction histidine kinase